MDTNLILVIAQIVAVSIVPLIVWWLGIKWQDHKTRQDAKVDLFSTLMRTRDISVEAREWIESLNLIDIVFQDDIKVRDAWHAYHDSLNENSPTHSSRDIYKIELLSEMAKSLGYKELRETEIARTYRPSGFKKKIKEENALRREWLRILSYSKSITVPFTEEETQKHIKELGL